METNYIVYALFNTCFPDIVRYVGLTTKTENHRLKGHWKSARRGKKYPVYDWMRKHGPDAVAVRVLGVYSSRQEMVDAEVFWIAHYRLVGQADLNITAGGEGTSGWRMSEQQREARRQYVLANPIQYEITPEHRKAVGDASRRRLSTPEAVRDHANKVGKIREETAQKIKFDIWNGLNDKDCEAKYGVSFKQVNNIRHGKSWAHVPWPIGPKKPTRVEPRPSGSRNPNAKITAEDVLKIRRMVRKMSYADVAARFGVSASTVNNIVRGKVWKHVPFEEGFPAISDDRDMGIQRLAVRGERSKVSKLTESQVRHVRRSAERGQTLASLGREMGVSDVTISNIVHRKTWKHIE